MDGKGRRTPVPQVHGRRSGAQRCHGDLARSWLPKRAEGLYLCLVHDFHKQPHGWGQADGGQGSESPGGALWAEHVRARRGEAASRRGEERRACTAMSVSAWEV